jgi:hypothetical protein
MLLPLCSSVSWLYLFLPVCLRGQGTTKQKEKEKQAMDLLLK